MLDAKSVSKDESISKIESVSNIEPASENHKIFEAYSRSKARYALIRPILDAAGAFLVLCLICLSFGAAPSSASPNVTSFTTLQLAQPPVAMKAVAKPATQPVIEIATTSSPANADAVYRRTSFQAAWGLLMIGLSLVVALNMALYRHLRQAYAVPQRRGKAPESTNF
jgi:hypothetical protein